MKIEYWADFTCPYSYIGSQSLNKALRKLDMDAKIYMNAYQLNPDMKPGIYESAKWQLIEKDGMKPEDADAQIEKVNAYGKECGLPLDFGNDHFCNTEAAHRLTAWAQDTDDARAVKLVSAIFHAVMAEGKNISDIELLEQLAQQAGFDGRQAREILESNAFAGQVRLQQEKADQIPVESIPYFVIDGTTIVDSSKTPEAWEEILKSLQ